TRTNNRRQPSAEASKQTYATIGPSITIHGDVVGEEDLLINGTLEGTINLKDNNLIVGEQGRVIADIIGRSACIEGEVRGEIRGSERVTVRKSGKVNGDIRSPRVVLDDGCQFKGSIDMDQDKAPSISAERKSEGKPSGGKRLPPLPQGNLFK
ncbi:MAG: polymer-forming cytoskeletal protein, partial [Pseudomonadota bacterium]|nr:polymer-forming cytoskeletal protein [Pseudomonadota bacterium]